MMSRDAFGSIALIAAMAFCSLSGGEEGTTPDQLKALVKEFAYREKPTLNPATEFKIEEHTVEGLKELKLQLLTAFYMSSKASHFNEEVFVCNEGKLSSFGGNLFARRLLSAVVAGGKCYYTYSSGSGRRRSHVGVVSIVDGKLKLVESDALFDENFFLKKNGAAIELEQGKFEAFNKWSSGNKVATISEKDAGFTALDDVGKEVSKYSSKPGK